MNRNPVPRLLSLTVALCFVLEIVPVAGLVSQSHAAEKPLAKTPVITPSTPKHSMPIKADIKGVRNLYLVVTDGGNGYGCDWADWAEPTLVGPAGKKPLTELKWKTAQADWGHVNVNRNANGEPLRIAGEPVKFGIGTHANSMIHFELPEGFETFEVRCGLDSGGTDQVNGGASSVQFFVYAQAPPAAPGKIELLNPLWEHWMWVMGWRRLCSQPSRCC